MVSCAKGGVPQRETHEATFGFGRMDLTEGWMSRSLFAGNWSQMGKSQNRPKHVFSWLVFQNHRPSAKKKTRKHKNARFTMLLTPTTQLQTHFLASLARHTAGFQRWVLPSNSDPPGICVCVCVKCGDPQTCGYRVVFPSRLPKCRASKQAHLRFSPWHPYHPSASFPWL